VKRRIQRLVFPCALSVVNEKPESQVANLYILSSNTTQARLYSQKVGIEDCEDKMYE
jgi:hypothetical protein